MNNTAVDQEKWAEYERLLSDLLISACADEDSMPEDDGRYPDDLFDERHAALDAFVLRLLERREPVGYSVLRVDAAQLSPDQEPTLRSRVMTREEAMRQASDPGVIEVVALLPVRKGGE